MKKTYISPESTVVGFTTESHILGSSVLNPGGGGNTGITPGEGEYGGEFNTQHKGWSSENWTEE